MIIRKQYNIKEMYAELAESYNKAVENKRSCVSVGVAEIMNIFDVLQELARREEQSQTLETALESVHEADKETNETAKVEKQKASYLLKEISTLDNVVYNLSRILNGESKNVRETKRITRESIHHIEDVTRQLKRVVGKPDWNSDWD